MEKPKKLSPTEYLAAVAKYVALYNEKEGKEVPDPRSGHGYRFLIEQHRKRGIDPETAAHDYAIFVEHYHRS